MSSKRNSDFQIENNKLFLKKNSLIVIVSLFFIGLTGFLLRFNFATFELPVTLDALLYFWYAIDMSQLGYFPSDYVGATNNGWPSFLSIFFSYYSSTSFLDYMVLQKLITISISVLTIIPIFFLCRRFVGEYFAIFGAALFVFEPRIVQNSLFGITEPLFLFLLSTSILFFLNEKIRFVYLSFLIAALATLVRAEGIFLFLALSIGFFLKYKNQKNEFPKYAICFSVFFLILLPMAMIRIDTIGEDGILSRISYSANTLSQNAISRGIENNDSTQLIILGLVNFVRFLGWSQIPLFLVFVPLGYVLMLKERTSDQKIIISFSIILSLPAIYALSVASDTRFLFSLYPLFCIAAVITLFSFSKKLQKNEKIIPIAIVAVLAVSVVYLDYKKIDLEHEKESLELAKIISTKTDRINLYPPESQYLSISDLYKVEKFPIVRSEFNIPYEVSDYGWPILRDFDSINESFEYLNENEISYLVVDGKENRHKFLNEVFYNDERFPFLEKEYDSIENGFNYHIKIYKINYEKWVEVINKNN